MTSSTWVHPHFSDPPVTEAVLDLQFSPLANWKTVHFGLYWQAIRERFPRIADQPPLASFVEPADGTTGIRPSLTVEMFSAPEVRCWFYNEAETELIQLQRNRFVFNWKRGLIEEPYPHYERIRPVVHAEWDRFHRFVQANDLGTLQVQQCEVTYINHLEKNVGWTNYGELSSVFPVWSGKTSEGLLPEPQGVEIGIRYMMPGNLGRLYVRAEPVIRNADFREVIQLTITARGKPASVDPDMAFDWLDAAQEWIAKGFVDITSETMHRLWGRNDMP